MPDTSENAQSATKHRARGKTRAKKPGHGGTAAGAVAPILDDETAAALTLYNTYLIADREQQAHERALKKAEKAKDEAAAAVRKLNDRNVPAAKMAEAETRYREAAETLQRLRDGDSPAPEGDSEEETGDTGEKDASAQEAGAGEGEGTGEGEGAQDEPDDGTPAPQAEKADG